MGVFINVSNHPSSKWGEKQRNAAREYGDIMDIPFPEVDPEAGTEKISDLAETYLKKIIEVENPVVMIQGEFTFSYALIRRLRENGITAVAGCTRRKAEEQVMPDGTTVKNSFFEFVGFREYE